MCYHNGSVWPHDNALIAAGLARYGFRARRRSGSSRACSTPRPTSTCGGCPSCSAASAAAQGPRPDLLSGRLLAAGLGGRHAALADPVLPRARLRRPADEIIFDEPVLPRLPRRGGTEPARLRRLFGRRGAPALGRQRPRRRHRAARAGAGGDAQLRRRGGAQAPPGHCPSCRSASPTTSAAARATLSDRRPARHGDAHLEVGAGGDRPRGRRGSRARPSGCRNRRVGGGVGVGGCPGRQQHQPPARRRGGQRRRRQSCTCSTRRTWSR